MVSSRVVCGPCDPGGMGDRYAHQTAGAARLDSLVLQSRLRRPMKGPWGRNSLATRPHDRPAGIQTEFPAETPVRFQPKWLSELNSKTDVRIPPKYAQHASV